MSISGPLVDGFGRVHTNLRVSVTDRCNIRCFYCMPAENVRFKPRRELLNFEDIALTTNGMLLAEQAIALRKAGLKRLNISLDSLNPETFFKISRREGLEHVLEGIFAAQKVGFEKIRLNAVAIR